MKKLNTSWENVNKWYSRNVDLEGNYYHKHIVIPNTLRLLDLKEGDSLLDLGCGQGVLERAIDKKVEYLGADASKSLIEFAKKNKVSEKHTFEIKDITKPLNLINNAVHAQFSYASIILVLQNVFDYNSVFENAKNYLKPSGKLLTVLNHPYFRTPKYSGWEINKENTIQYRRVDSYMTPKKTNIETSPSKGANSETTLSFHFPLQDYSKSLQKNGFTIMRIEEWVSNKVSDGKHAEMENIARREFPLFMALMCKKV